MRHFLLPLIASVLAANAHDLVTPDPKLLQDRVPVSRLAGEQGEGVTFKIELPPGAENFVVKTTTGSGDVAIYLGYGAHPTPTQYDAMSDTDDTNLTTELVRVGAPLPGMLYVRLIGMTAFRNVRVIASYDLPRGVVRPPRMLPAPGCYAERAVVRLTRPRGTTLRYTTDGSAPDASSPIYTGRLTLTADTQIRARTFGRDDTVSIETVGGYTVVPLGTVQTLTPGMPAHHLAAMRRAAHEFKITVPPATAMLSVKMEGGPGDAQLYAKAGAVPTSLDFDHRAINRGNSSTLSIANPQAGDWYLRVPARVGYSGVSLLATARPDGVDLIAWAPALEPYVTTETFAAGDCEVEEGMTTAGTHRLLRFSTQTRNIGAKDLMLGDPEGNPAFEYQDCHGHYHFLGFASYELLDVNGQPAAIGLKVSFCLLDGLRWDSKAPSTGRFNCNEQGIQAGWADVYDAGLAGQWIELDGVPPGTYTLVITMNPAQVLEETDYTNNSASTQVVIEP